MTQKTDTDGGLDVFLGARLRAAREQLGWSEQALAARMRIKAEHVRDYETGAKHVPVPRLVELSDALRVPIGYFFGGPTTENRAKPAPGVALPEYRTTLALVRAFWQIADPTHRKMVLDLIKEVAERSIGNDRGAGPH